MTSPGSSETSRPTTHSQPTYVEEGVTHDCVANIPGAVARTSTLALTSATLPYLVTVAEHGITGSAKADAALRAGLSTLGGRLVSEPAAEAHEMPFTDPGALLASEIAAPRSPQEEQDVCRAAAARRRAPVQAHR